MTQPTKCMRLMGAMEFKIVLKNLLFLPIIFICLHFTSCTTPKSQGEKLGHELCDCKKQYANNLNNVYQDYLANFDSFGFTTSQEASQKWQEILNLEKKNYDECTTKVDQKCKEAKTKFQTDVGQMFDPDDLQKAMSNPQKYAKEVAKKQKSFAKNLEKNKEK
ncbi:MAG: hypothetical protein LBC84_01610, partial [Prevotellaceae bacterium]|nr:hypothetical protein [Prevotellaceae bacterium]